MDNKKINIDQLFQSRLDDFESPMPEHAWGQMKSILDAEMPEKKKRLGFGPFFNVVALSVILASASFGGYQLLKGEIAADAGKRFTLEPYADNEVSDVRKFNATASVSASSDNSTQEDAPLTASTEIIADSKVLPTTGSTNHWRKQATASNAVKSETAPIEKENPTVQVASSTPTVAKKIVSQEPTQALSNNNISKTTSTSNTTAKTSDNTVATTAQGSASNTSINKTITNTAFTNQNSPNNQTSNNNTVIAKTDNDMSDKSVSSNANAEITTSKDSINVVTQRTKLTIDRVNQKAITHTEIIETSKIEAPVQFQNGQINSNTDVAKVDNANTIADNEESGNIGLATQRQKVRNKKSNTYTKQSNQTIDELKTQAKYLVQQMYLSYGILGGANFTALNSGNLYGFHLGVHGAFHFNEKWSIGAEVRFRQQFNSGFELTGYKNQLRSVDSLETSNGTIYNYHYDSMNTNYKFATIQSLNVPIMLQYNLAKWRLMAGVNINYTFNIGTEELAYSFPSIYRDTVYGINTSPKSFEQNSSLTYRDFQNKFGLGFIFGVGYEITPRVTLDLRMMQNQYNNSFTQGEKTISKHLLAKPNFQFTIQYKLGEKKLK